MVGFSAIHGQCRSHTVILIHIRQCFIRLQFFGGIHHGVVLCQIYQHHLTVGEISILHAWIRSYGLSISVSPEIDPLII